MNETLKPITSFNTAVLFLIFNRPDTTARVFEAIRSAKPPRLYVAADGARAGIEGDAEKVARARLIGTAVDWPCEVKTLFREENLGCKRAVGEAITWFFDFEEQGIILEDDCLPHQDFFRFSESVLNHYKDDERVSVVTGNNFQYEVPHREVSYYFSKYNHCWGWATWRRAWRHYQSELPFWPEWSKSIDWRNKTPDPVERLYWSQIFKRVCAGKIDTWDYPWTACVWYHNGLTVTPHVNLVSNIGFGQDSTHTADADSPLSAIPTKAIGKIKHPVVVDCDLEADRDVFEHVIGIKNKKFPYSLLARLLRLLRRHATTPI